MGYVCVYDLLVHHQGTAILSRVVNPAYDEIGAHTLETLTVEAPGLGVDTAVGRFDKDLAVIVHSAVLTLKGELQVNTTRAGNYVQCSGYKSVTQV